jgi:hypothetical protein
MADMEAPPPSEHEDEASAKVSPPEQEAPATPVLDSHEEGQRAAIAEVEVLDIVGFLATAAAAVILIVNDDANQWWWLGVGLAAALIVISAARLIPMRRRNRATRAPGDTA